MEDIKEAVWGYYRQNQRELPWREGPSEAYEILVAEVMLQQTQAQRVIPKYKSFLARFPNIETLAQANLSDVLREWSGLGYNRRAKYLHEAAKQLQTKQNWTVEDLEACKGVGKNTAAAVIVYTYNNPQTFIETNIRTVFIHHFFGDEEKITDKELLVLVEEVLDKEDPREWYWALMDYGAFLKKAIGNTSRQSKHYSKQSRFDGSRRQIRGEVLRRLAHSQQTAHDLALVITDSRLKDVLASLEKEGLIRHSGNLYDLAI